MGMIEAPFGDLVLGIMQNPYVRWSAGFIVMLWVWLVGDQDARFRRFYLVAPLAVALLLQVVDSLFLGAATGKSGQGGWFEHYLSAMEALRRIASLIGVGAILGAVVCGFTRMLGGTLLMMVLLCAFFADQMMPQAKSFFSGPVFAQMLALLPSVSIVLLTAYGVGATLRHLRERYDVRENS
jgi:hypothetical protein